MPRWPCLLAGGFRSPRNQVIKVIPSRPLAVARRAVVCAVPCAVAVPCCAVRGAVPRVVLGAGAVLCAVPCPVWCLVLVRCRVRCRVPCRAVRCRPSPGRGNDEGDDNTAGAVNSTWPTVWTTGGLQRPPWWSECTPQGARSAAAVVPGTCYPAPEPGGAPIGLPSCRKPPLLRVGANQALEEIRRSIGSPSRD